MLAPSLCAAEGHSCDQSPNTARPPRFDHARRGVVNKLQLSYVSGNVWNRSAHPARLLRAAFRLGRGQLTAATAARITSATTCGWEIMTTCDASTSVTWAPLRAAIALAPVGPIALSAVPTTAQDGSVFHAGFVVGSPNPTSAAGSLRDGHHRGLLIGEVGAEHLVERGRVDDRTRSPVGRPPSGTGPGATPRRAGCPSPDWRAPGSSRPHRG